MIEHALAWAHRGWRVFPLAPNSKTQPLISKWQDRATTDADLIREWWFEWPDANIGGLCGEDWLVVDVDIRDGKQGIESLERLQADYQELAPSLEHSTPSGGWHCIYRKPANWGVTSKMQDFAGYADIDVQVGGAYIVLPPSRTPEGAYAVKTARPIADGPLWLVDARNGATGKGAHSPKLAIANLGQVMHKRDNQLYRLASLLRGQGHSFEYVVEQLRTAAASPLAYPLHGPKPEQDILRIVRSAFRHPADLFTGLSATNSTDLDNGSLLSVLSAGELLWHNEHGAWFEWTGSRWRKSGYRLRKLTAEAIEALWGYWHASTEEGEQKAVVKRIETLCTWTRLSSAWEFLKTDVWAEAEEFDSEPYLLNCANGTVDLRTGALSPHNPADRITRVTREAYDPSADMGEWEGFVLWCAKGDPELARWLKSAFGQAMIGRVNEQIMTFLYGPGNNGKSQLVKAILLTIGDYGHEAPVSMVATRGRDQIHDEYLVALQGRRLVVCPEPERGMHWLDNRVKDLTGGDGIPCRPNYGKPMTIRPQFMLVVHGNNRPEIRDRSDGFRRRMRLVPFDNRVSAAQRVADYAEVLAGPGVLRWLVEGAREWLTAQSLPGCARVEEDSVNYLTGGNQIGRFAEDECIFHRIIDEKSVWTETADIYAVYRLWCRINGETFIETCNGLMEQLRNTIRWDDGEPKIRAQRKERRGKVRRGWYGVELVNDPKLIEGDLPA